MANPKETIILYDGKQIASFSAGQTATLTTKGDEVEHNIVVVAGSGGGASKPVLQEKTATENGVVLPDRGYDGLSKVTVDVKNSGGGGGITTSATSKKSEMRYVSSQMGAIITTTATASVA